MSVLVTGASGFVGQAVCVSALRSNLKVRGTYRSALSGRLLHGSVEKIQIASVDRDTDWSGTLSQIDVVIHLAARAHVSKDASRDPLKAFREVNTKGTERLAKAAAAAGVRRFVFVSTIKVNGEETFAEPFCEADFPRPQDAYALSKWESEQALQQIGQESGMEVVVVRPPLVYGPGVRANFLRLLDFVKRRVPLPLASVNNRRSLIYVSNLADAILACAMHPSAAGQTYLVSDTEAVSTPELIDRIAGLMGLRSRTFACPTGLLSLAGKLTGRTGEVERLLGSLVVNGARIQSDTGWSPRYSLSEGLAATIDWYMAGGLSECVA